MKTRLSEIEAYLKSNAKVGEGLCPFCGTDRWLILSPNIPESASYDQEQEFELYPANFFGQTTALISYDFLVPVFLLTCSKCGFVRTQSMQMFEKWVQAKSNNSSDTNDSLAE